MEYKYDVFFSYRHKPLDSQLTQTVFNMLESYRLPGSVRSRDIPISGVHSVIPKNSR